MYKYTSMFNNVPLQSGQFPDSMVEVVDVGDGIEGFDHPKHVSKSKVNSLTVIELDFDDPLVTPHG